MSENLFTQVFPSLNPNKTSFSISYESLGLLFHASAYYWMEFNLSIKTVVSTYEIFLEYITKHNKHTKPISWFYQ